MSLDVGCVELCSSKIEVTARLGKSRPHMAGYERSKESAPTMQMLVSLPRVKSESVPIALQLGMGVAALTLLSQVLIPLPFTPVPLSLGTLGAMLLGALLGPRVGVGAAALYALLGTLGASVFAGWASGVGVASFGYVLGYVAAAGLVGLWVQSPRKATYPRSFGVALAASALVYVFGVSWLVVVVGVPLGAAIGAGVAPFLVGDLLKAFVIAGTVSAVKPGS